MTIRIDQSRLTATRDAQHPHCVVCGQAGPGGLRLDFKTTSNGEVAAAFRCTEQFQGYAGVLHGGVICSLLDSAMTNCLFARGIAAVTAEMTVRFHSPVALDRQAQVVGRLSGDRSPLFMVEAEMTQDGVVAAKATAKFVKRTVGTMFSGARCHNASASRVGSPVAVICAQQYAKIKVSGGGGP